MTLPANTNPDPALSPLEPVFIVLLRKLVLLGLLMVVAALGLVLLLRHIQIYSLILPHVLSDAAMGLVAGLSVRWVLRKQSVYLRMIALLAFLLGGLELLGWFTGWQIGLDPLELGHSRVDWFSLGQLFLASGISLLSLYAWVPPLAPVPQSDPDPKSPKRSPRPRQQLEKRRRLQHPETLIEPDAVAEQPVKAARKHRARRKPRLQLSVEEEHRCPYCLELVIPDDPRGVVECQVCHTLHHADCWAITGACQVPHYNV